MSEAEKKSRDESGGGETAKPKHDQGFRETIESLAVAVILALLFRGFVAEAFVIPTGSMAPTLMGAHKDVDCPQCGYQYQAGASLENRDPAPGRGNYLSQDVWRNGRSVFATICPNCRSENGLQLGTNSLHDTFDGDRILVSKFSYALSEPERWDVIVFKYPHNAKQNYIKRLVGLENETLRIQSGDVYAKPDGDEQYSILRKSPAKQLAMSHLVYDTAHQARALVEAGWPSRWQPWQWGATAPPTDGWQVQQQPGYFSAHLDDSAAADESNAEQPTQWLRYFHRLPTDEQWERAKQGLTLAGVEPYRGSAVTDFYGYDAYVSAFNNFIFDAPGRLRSSYDPEAGQRQFPVYQRVGPGQVRPVVEVGNSGIAERGMHWVGDLMVETTAEVHSDDGLLYLDLVEAGAHHRCEIDVATGSATLRLIKGDDVAAFDGEKNLQPTAATPVQGPGIYHLRFANYDDQLRLWVDGDYVEFDQPTTFDPLTFQDLQRPHYTAADPLDAAPVAIGGDGITMTLQHLKVLRDKYYIAPPTRLYAGDMMADYDLNQLQQLGFFDQQVEEPNEDPYWRPRLIHALFGLPERWDEFAEFWATRRQLEFRLGDNQYFPMGDNSPESQDARSWPGEPFIERDMLIGKALLIFWPHAWPEPIPFTPNFSRMRFIR